MKPWVPLCVLLCGAALACAQDLPARDPTEPPSDLNAPAGGAGAASPLGEEGQTVIVRDGKPYLAVGTRLYAVGQKVGRLTVQRITETEVWLRDGDAQYKLPRFPGIERAVSAVPSCVDPTPEKNKRLNRSSAKARNKAVTQNSSTMPAVTSKTLSAACGATSP